MLFSFIMNPVAKGRPKMGRWGVYTPKKTVNAEKTIQAFIRGHTACPTSPLNRPCSVQIHFVLPMPTSWSEKKRRAFKDSAHIQRPDIDNLGKLVMDALNGILWEDDSQIATLTMAKRWGDIGLIKIMVE